MKIYEKPTASYLHGSTRLKFNDLDSEKTPIVLPESPEERNKLTLCKEQAFF